MQKWTSALSRAVSTQVARLVPPKTSQISGIPRDPLKHERLEIESLQNLLGALYENQRWLLVTLLNFSCQHEYVAKLADATAHRTDLRSGVHAFQDATLRIHAECVAYTNEVRENLERTHKTMEELSTCLKQFEQRLKCFQTAVEYRMKVKKAETDMIEGTNTGVSLQKQLERWTRKGELAKNEFREQHQQLEESIKELLEKARNIESDVFAATLRCQRLLAERLHKSYSALEGTESHLRQCISPMILEQSAARQAEAVGSTASLTNSDGAGRSSNVTSSVACQTASAGLPTDIIMEGEKSDKRLPAQLFLLTHRSEMVSADQRRSVPLLHSPSHKPFRTELEEEDASQSSSVSLPLSIHSLQVGKSEGAVATSSFTPVAPIRVPQLSQLMRTSTAPCSERIEPEECQAIDPPNEGDHSDSIHRKQSSELHSQGPRDEFSPISLDRDDPISKLDEAY